MSRILSCWLPGLLLTAALPVLAQAQDQPQAETPEYGPQLQGFEYPYTVKHFAFESQGKSLQMGYMDIAAQGKVNGRSVVLMHGKNFCAATWDSSIKALSEAGYRVIAPDQIGFCTSSKPDHYQYSFQQLATNTQQLLKALGVPYRTVDQWFERELKVTAQGIHDYQRTTYYDGRWKPEFDRWVNMYAGLAKGSGKTVVAWNSALIYDMIFSQPVYYEFKDLKVPTLLLIGTSDTTAINKDIAPPEVKAKIGHYDVLGKQVAKLIPQSTLIEFPGLGHAPQMEEPAKFHQALLGWLNQTNPVR